MKELDENDVFLPFEVWVEIDEETDDERVYGFSTFEEAEKQFKECRRYANSKVVFRQVEFSNNIPKIIATYYP
jgi:acyl-CoA hydrolase